jgi:ADP-ribose pyrophosphatase YjhB (NUDIX family)
MSPIVLQVGVKVLLKNSDGKILLLKRSEEKYGKTQGSWDIPGGRIDPGSELIANLKREVEEETRLAMISAPRLVAAQDIMPPERHIVRLTYTAHTEGEPVLDLTESTEYRWLTFAELAAEQDLDTYVRQLIGSGLVTPESWNAL